MSNDVLQAIATDIELSKAFESAGKLIKGFKGEYSFYHLDRRNPQTDVMVSSLVIGAENDPYSCSLTRKYEDDEGFPAYNQTARGKIIPTEPLRALALLMCNGRPTTLHVDLAHTAMVKEGVRNMTGVMMITEQEAEGRIAQPSIASPFYAVRSELPVYPLVMPAADVRLSSAKRVLFGQPKSQP